MDKLFRSNWRIKWRIIDSKIKGYICEQIVAQKLKCYGYSIIFLPKNWPNYDLLAFKNDKWHKVQVKSINKSKIVKLKSSSAKKNLEFDILIGVNNIGQTFLKKITKSIGSTKLSSEHLWADEIKIDINDFLPNKK